jgi:urease accessory protein UreE
MDERRVRPRRLRHGRRLTDGTVLVTSYDDDGRVIHAIRYDESMKHVLEELEGEAAEAAYAIRGSDEIGLPEESGAD